MYFVLICLFFDGKFMIICIHYIVELTTKLPFNIYLLHNVLDTYAGCFMLTINVFNAYNVVKSELYMHQSLTYM